MCPCNSTPLFRLHVTHGPYGRPIEFGTYFTRALAEVAMQDVIALWPAIGRYSMDITDVEPRVVRPEIHRFKVFISLLDSAVRETVTLAEPTLNPLPVPFHLLDHPARHVGHALAEASGTGETVDLATYRAELCHQKLVGLGAVEILWRSIAVRERAVLLADRRANELSRQTGHVVGAWQLIADVTEELASAEFGSEPML